MQTLKPFQGPLPFAIEAELTMRDHLIRIEFKLDPNSTAIKGLPEKSQQWTSDQVPRQDQLWATTCFEAFLKPIGDSAYYEFNFSLLPAWNAYEFTSYRAPQPPTPSKAFNLKSISWSAEQNFLTIELENKTSHQEFSVSLTSVIEESNGTIHYWALNHTSDKPNFHSQGSFTLVRGSKK